MNLTKLFDFILFQLSTSLIISDLPFHEVEENPNLAMVITKTGGHIGFLEGWIPTGGTWLNRAVNEFIQIMTYTNFLQNNEFKDIDDYY